MPFQVVQVVHQLTSGYKEIILVRDFDSSHTLSMGIDCSCYKTRVEVEDVNSSISTTHNSSTIVTGQADALNLNKRKRFYESMLLVLLADLSPPTFNSLWF